MSVEKLAEIQSKVLGKFPNTYVFTKNLSEKILQASKPENMTVTIIRPSIVGCSYIFPMPGWLDSISASAAIFLFAGLGILKHLNGRKEIIGDNIPVDFVADFCIVVAAGKANS